MNDETIYSRITRQEAAPFCWLWNGTHTGSQQRPQATVNGNKMYVARFMYGRFREWVAPSVKILHACDNPKCVNPFHLFAGNQQMNVLDSLNKGRWSSQKVNVETVKSIREQLATTNKTQTQIAKDFGVSDGIVSTIKTGRTWSHI